VYSTVKQDGKLFMISYPELNEFAKLCFADDLDAGTLCTIHTSTRNKYVITIINYWIIKFIEITSADL